MKKIKNIFHEVKDKDGIVDISYSGRKELPRLPKSTHTLIASGNSISSFSQSQSLQISSLRLVHLDLSGNSLTTLPESFASLPLKYLNVSYNQISAMPFAAIYELQHCEYLDISHNGLSQIMDGIAKMKQLEVLKASNNHIKAVSKDLELMHLKELVLSHNQLVNVPRLNSDVLKLDNNLFEEVPEVEYKQLDLSHNKVSSITPSRLKNIVDLTYNKLKSIPGGIKDVESLDLRENDITDWPLDARVMNAIKFNWAEVKQFDSIIDINAELPAPLRVDVAPIPPPRRKRQGDNLMSPSKMAK